MTYDLYDKQNKCYVGYNYSEEDADDLVRAFKEWHGDILEKRQASCLCEEKQDKHCYQSSCTLNEGII